MVARVYDIEERGHEVRIIYPTEYAETKHRKAALEERPRHRHPDNERNREAKTGNAKFKANAGTHLDETIADSAADENADDRPDVMPKDRMQPRPLLQEWTVIQKRRLEMARHPVLEPDVDIDHHREAQYHADRRRLREDGLDRICYLRPVSGSRRHNRLRIPEENRKDRDPRKTYAAKYPEWRAPALPALARKPPCKAAATDYADVKAQLQDRYCGSPRFPVQLRYD